MCRKVVCILIHIHSKHVASGLTLVIKLMRYAGRRDVPLRFKTKICHLTTL